MAASSRNPLPGGAPEAPPSRRGVPLSRRIAGMFGRIAPGYDRANRLLSCGMDIAWRKRVGRELQQHFGDGEGRVILDLAAGTMDLSIEAARRLPRASILALDLCLPMLRAGEKKRARAFAGAGMRIQPVAADAFALPLPDPDPGSAKHGVDAVLCAFGLRNMSPRADALAEMRRVLRPGGRVWILEFGSAKGRLWGGAYNLYLHTVLPRLGGLVAGDGEAYRYLARTIESFPSAETLAEEMREAGFSRTAFRSVCGGIVFLHLAEK